MRRTTGNIFMVMAVVLAASLAVVSCRKTEVEANGGLDSGESVSEGVPMIFSVSADAHQPTKAVLVPDDSPDGNKLSIAGNQITVYDKLTVAGNPGYDMYINGRTAQYDADPVYDPADGSVIHPGWYFYNGISRHPYYWTRSGTHLFTAFLSGYHVADKDEPGGFFFNDIDDIIADPSDPDEPKKLAVQYNDADGSLKIENWTISTSNQFDFMYASHTRDLEDINELDPYRPVPLEMKHLFTAVQFNVINLIPDYTVAYGGFFLYNLHNKGSAIIRKTDSTGETSPDILLSDSHANITRSLSGYDDIGYGVENAVNVFKNCGNIGDDGCLLLWPQENSMFGETDGIYAQISLMKDTNYQTPTVSLLTDNIRSWEPGRKYVYNIYIQDNRISFTVEIVDWIYDDIVIEG